MELLNGSIVEAEGIRIGDRCKIVKYGHCIWTKKEAYKEMFEAGYTGGKEKPDGIIKENETIYYHDIRPEFVGQEVIITNISETQGKYGYSTTLFSWADRQQLEKI